jgi:hypothetical protein
LFTNGVAPKSIDASWRKSKVVRADDKIAPKKKYWRRWATKAIPEKVMKTANVLMEATNKSLHT